MQDGGVPSEHWNIAALFVDNAFIPLINMEMFVKAQQINLWCTLHGCKKILTLIVLNTNFENAVKNLRNDRAFNQNS